MNYLLSSQILLDLCAEEVNAAQQWSRDIPAESLRISVISSAQAASEIATGGHLPLPLPWIYLPKNATITQKSKDLKYGLLLGCSNRLHNYDCYC